MAWKGLEPVLKKVAKSPAVLGAGIVIGTGGTAVLASIATAKACKKIAEEEKRLGRPLTKKEKAKLCWKYYILSGASLLATGGLTAYTLVTSEKNIKNVKGALAAMTAFNATYIDKVKERHGKEEHNAIMKEISEAKEAQKTYIYEGTFGTDMSLGVNDVDDEVRLFYDTFSERYFHSTLSRVIAAEYHVNRNVALGCDSLTPNDFYDFLGIPRIKKGDQYKWSSGYLRCNGYYFIEFYNSVKKIDNDSLDVIVINFDEPLTLEECAKYEDY